MTTRRASARAASAAEPDRLGKEFYVLGVVFCTLWSSAFIAAKFGLTVSPPLSQLSIRFLFAGLLLWGAMIVLKRPWPAQRRDIWTGVILGLLNNSIYLGAFFIAMQSITAGLAALIAALTPLVTVLLALPFLGERITKRSFLGVIAGLIGAIIVLNGRLSGETGVDAPIGIVLAFFGMLCLSAGTIVYRARGAKVDLLAMNTVQTIASGLALLPVALIFEDWSAIVFNHVFFLSTGYLAIMLSIVALILWFRMIQLGGAGRASAFHFLNPGLGMLFGFAILVEPLAWMDLLGLIPIVVGIILVTWTPRRAPARPRT